MLWSLATHVVQRNGVLHAKIHTTCASAETFTSPCSAPAPRRWWRWRRVPRPGLAVRRRPARRARGGQRAGCALGVHEANARPRGTLSSPTRRRRGGPATARRRRAGRGRGAARTGRSTSCVRRRAERTCGAWRRRTAVSGAEPTAVRGESKRWALGGPLGDRACRGAVHARVHGGRAKQGGIGRRGTCSLKVVEGARQEHLPSVLSAFAWPAAPRGPPTVQMRARGGEGARAGAAAHHLAPPL